MGHCPECTFLTRLHHSSRKAGSDWSTIGASTREGEPRPRYHDQREVVPGWQGLVSSAMAEALVALRAVADRLGLFNTRMVDALYGGR